MFRLSWAEVKRGIERKKGDQGERKKERKNGDKGKN